MSIFEKSDMALLQRIMHQVKAAQKQAPLEPGEAYQIQIGGPMTNAVLRDEGLVTKIDYEGDRLSGAFEPRRIYNGLIQRLVQQGYIAPGRPRIVQDRDAGPEAVAYLELSAGDIKGIQTALEHAKREYPGDTRPSLPRKAVRV